jgi:hypothetical protein
MNQRLKDDIGILIFAAILSFTIVMACAGMLNAERILDYRMQQARQEIIEGR